MYKRQSGLSLGHVTPTIFGIRSNISLKLLELETSNLIHGFVWAMPSRRINNFPESRRGSGHVTLTIFGSTVGYPSESLASCSHILWYVIKEQCFLVREVRRGRGVTVLSRDKTEVSRGGGRR